MLNNHSVTLQEHSGHYYYTKYSQNTSTCSMHSSTLSESLPSLSMNWVFILLFLCGKGFPIYCQSKLIKTHIAEELPWTHHKKKTIQIFWLGQITPILGPRCACVCYTYCPIYNCLVAVSCPLSNWNVLSKRQNLSHVSSCLSPTAAVTLNDRKTYPRASAQALKCFILQTEWWGKCTASVYNFARWTSALYEEIRCPNFEHLRAKWLAEKTSVEIRKGLLKSTLCIGMVPKKDLTKNVN